MAATVTLLGSVTLNTTSGTHTVVATPAVDDLIVIVTATTGNISTAPPTDNNSGGAGTYATINSAYKASSADLMMIHIRTALIGSATSTTFTHAPGTTTGGGLAVFKVTGVFLSGAAAAVQSATQNNQAAAGTPTPVFAAAAGTGNAIIGAVFNATNPATMTPRSSPAYTERNDSGYATPTTGLETMSINSGETGTSIAWGGTSASAFSSLVLELNANTAAPTVALNTPADAGSISDTTPQLDFTGTDADNDDIRYNMQLGTGTPLILGTVIDSYAESNQDLSDAFGTAILSTKKGQSFTGNGSAIGSARFYLKNVSGSTGTANVILYAHTGTFGSTGTPTGSALATGSLDVSGVGTNYELVNVPTTPFTLVNATKYFICIEYVSNVASSFYWGGDSTTPSHGGNRANCNSSGTYIADSSSDMVFYVHDDTGNILLDKRSNADAGFDDPDSADTDPFTSGVNITYDVQAGDALVVDTYYWRVRGLDPAGSKSYGSWSSTRSFNVISGSIPNKIYKLNQAIQRSGNY